MRCEILRLGWLLAAWLCVACGGESGSGKPEAEAGAGPGGETGEAGQSGTSTGEAGIPSAAGAESAGGSMGIGGEVVAGGAETAGGTGNAGGTPGVGGETAAGGTESAGGRTGLGGESAVGGAASGGAESLFVEQVAATRPDKIDLLFVIDNSLSMGDKQEVLAAAVPQLLARLTNPDCIVPDDATRERVASSAPNRSCAEQGLGAEYQKEFSPISDIHIGFVTSALGDNGGNYCPEGTAETPENIAQNDHAWLTGALDPTRSGLSEDMPQFLAWSAADSEGYTTAITTRTEEFRSLVMAAGELGCGLEMTMEAWYRFLVDPMPPLTVDLRIPGDTTSNTIRSSVVDPENGVDQSLLAQRRSFLRPDSLLAVAMLSDENDCSLKDSGIAFLPGTITAMRRGTSTCDTDPNSPCCYSCWFDSDQNRPSGCSADVACQQNGGAMDASTDFSGLRCYEQKRRFGYDFLMPIERYLNALTQPELCLDNDALTCVTEAEDPIRYASQASSRYPNPIFTRAEGAVVTGLERKSPEMVFLTGIVGVPWQDLATDQSLDADTPLSYQLASELDWDLILPTGPGDVADDPHMRESTAPRSGTNPRTGEAIAAPESAMRDANAINMHEWLATGDLQYACTFDLSQPLSEGATSAAIDCLVDCAVEPEPSVCERRLASCACTTRDTPEVTLSPLCQDPVTGAYGTTQYAAKAYPSVRQLELLRLFHQRASAPGLSDNAVVASICPKNLDIAERMSSGYGYNPATNALVSRMKDKLVSGCMPRELTVDGDGTIPCAVIEAVPPSSASCDCAAFGRAPVVGELDQAVRLSVARANLCDGEGQSSCSELCLCELPQLSGAAREACLTTPGIETSAAGPGFCYLDPAAGVGSAAVLAACDETEQHMLRIVGSAALPAPAPEASVFLACTGGS